MKRFGLVNLLFLILQPLAVFAFDIGGQTVGLGTRMDLRLGVAAGESDPATFIPVSIIRGAQSGPVLLISTGVHGYEFAPIIAAERLADELDPALIRGTVVLTRPGHVSAFEARSPYVNPYDRKNLNRSFPGDASGTQTERIAHALSTELIAKADFVADVHSGDGAEWLQAFVGVYGGPLATDYEVALAFAEAMGIPTLVRYQMRTQQQIDSGRSLNRQAVAAGVPTVLVEIGENGGRDPGHVDVIVTGIQSAMVSLGMLRDEFALPALEHRYFEGTQSVPVSHSGLWHPRAASGREIKEGEVLGVVKDYTGAIVETVIAPTSGHSIYGLAGPPIRAGESVMTIAKPTASLRD